MTAWHLFYKSVCVGQEEGGVDIEEGVRFTPFNMREEMEEGHFDTEGMYIFKRNKVSS